LIHKVNSPPVLKLVTNPAQSTNTDSGSGSGSGLGYEAPQHKQQDEPQKNPHSQLQSNDHSKPKDLSLDQEKNKDSHSLLRANQVGLTKIFEFFKSKVTGNKDDLASRYQNESNTARGILLNKKAE
jgi:hypothetical protein